MDNNNDQVRAQSTQDLSEQTQIRMQKLADLKAAGRDPYLITKFDQNAFSADLKEEFAVLPTEADSGKKVKLAGRLMSTRVMGKASFAHLGDDKGDIQLYVRRDELGDEEYAAFKKLDIGDVIGVEGEVFRTRTGELSVRADELLLLEPSRDEVLNTLIPMYVSSQIYVAFLEAKTSENAARID